MATTVKTGWLHDKNGDKFAPKTLISQVQTNDGILLEDKIQAELENAKINVTVEPGQTIRAKTIDENGKPVEWEAADYQEKICDAEMTFIVPEQECVYDEDLQMFAAQGNGTLTVGYTYNVTYNGNSHSCKCVAVSDGAMTVNMLGNTDALMGTGDNGMPFVIADYVVAGMLGVFMVKPFDDAESVTLSIEGETVIKIPTKFIPTLEEMRTETVEILPETMFELDPETGAGEFLVDFALGYNKTYTIVYNGIEYPDCVGVDIGDGGLYFGNLSVLDESFPATNHPFILASAAGDFDEDSNIDYALMLGALDGLETVTLAILEEKVHRLHEKYLPESVPLLETSTNVILPETTVEINLEEGAGIVPIDFALEPDKPYTIKYNGVEYPDCVGTQVEIGLVFGNMGAVEEGFPVTGHPFILMSGAIDMDGDGNIDYLVAVVPLDGSESITVSIIGEVQRIPNKYLPTLEEMRTEIIEILPETTIEVDPDMGEGEIPVDFALKANKAYTIKYNGVEYTNCTGTSLEEGMLHFGNLNALTDVLPDTGHPFALVSRITDIDEDGNVDYFISIISLDDSESITLSILEENIHKIPPKYLPDGIGYEDTVEFLPNTVLTLSENDDTILLESNKLFIDSHTYTINWNGTNYTCTAFTYENIELPEAIILGNLAAVEGIGDTGEPFIILTSRLDVDKYALGIYPLDGSTVVTLAIDENVARLIPSKYLPEGIGYEEIIEVLPESTIGLVEGEQYFGVIAKSGLQPEKTYIVNWNGTSYTCVGQQLGGNGWPYLGNASLVAGVNTGEPFLILSQSNALMTIPLDKSLETVTISIVQHTLHKIPEKYLPDIGIDVDVPTKVSQLENDAGYTTAANHYTKTESDDKYQTKGNYLTSYTETDPTVPSWAKASTKPTYTKSEVGLSNVDNVKQYSASNPPPYPVTSVNGKTGAVSLSASDVDAYTKSEIDNLELITIADIDAICGATI